MTQDRESGIIFPTIGENFRRGYFMQNGDTISLRVIILTLHFWVIIIQMAVMVFALNLITM